MSVLTQDVEANPTGPLRNPWDSGGLTDVIRRRYLLRLLVSKELTVRYQGSFVGLAWSYVKPAVRFAMYFWVIGLILTARSENRGLQIFSAMVMVSFFTNALVSGTKSVVKNKTLVTKINLPREMFPVASIAVSLYHMLPTYVLLFFGALLVGWKPDQMVLPAALLGFGVVVVWGLGTALLFSALNVFFRDMENVVDVVQTVITWTVPMIYPFSIIKDQLHGIAYQIYLLSPLTNAVLLNGRAFWTPADSHPAQQAALEMPAHLFERGVIMLVAGIVFVVIAQIVFSRLERRFAERI
ncbi:MAG: ABC transporter permease [Nocardioidaceae bacterium]